MTSRDRFVELVKLYVTIRESGPGGDPRTAVEIVARAMLVPEWAPRVEDVRAEGGIGPLVSRFVLWNYREDGFETPEWFFRAAGPGHDSGHFPADPPKETP